MRGAFTFALLAAIAAAATLALPRNEDRVVYPTGDDYNNAAQATGSYPNAEVNSRSTSYAKQAPVLIQSEEEVNKEIDSYIQNPVLEKHIFRNKDIASKNDGDNIDSDKISKSSTHQNENLAPHQNQNPSDNSYNSNPENVAYSNPVNANDYSAYSAPQNAPSKEENYGYPAAALAPPSKNEQGSGHAPSAHAAQEPQTQTNNGGYADTHKPSNGNYNNNAEENEREENQAHDDQGSPVRFDGTQLWKIPIDDIHKIKVVNGLATRQAITTWGGSRESVDAMISPDMVANVSGVLTGSGIPYEVIITDLQKAIEEENPPLDEEQLELQHRRARTFNFWRYRAASGQIVMPVLKPPNRRAALFGADLGYNSLDDHMEYWPKANWGHRMTWSQYHRVDDIYSYMNFLANTYPQLCKVQSIGRSSQGRDIKMLTISNGNPGNVAVFIDGGIHAREWISPATVTYIMNYVIENYDNGPAMFREVDWYIVPVLNPDGYEYTHTTNRLWRKTRSGNCVEGYQCCGVDLNRNFGYKWGGKGTSNSQCSDVYRGSYAFSEPESRALRDFLLGSTANFKLYATYHSYGQFILYPWGYDEVVPPDYKDLQLAGTKAAEAIQRSDGTAYKVGTSSIVLYPSAGGSDDWAKAIRGIKYTYTVELPDTGKHGFVLPAQYILRVGKASIEGLKVLVEFAIKA